jgi:plastocyanin
LSLRDPRVIVMGVTVCVAVVLAIIGAGFTSSREPTAVPVTRSAVIQMTQSGFFPAALTVKAGTPVVWHDVSAAPLVVASNPYPADTSVKGLHSTTILPGGSYSFTPNTAETISYHDDGAPTLGGTITVTK